MARTRQQVKQRRIILVESILGGAFLFSVIRYGLGVGTMTAKSLLGLFQLPPWYLSIWPLDMAAVCLGAWITLYAIFNFVGANLNDASFLRSWLEQLLGIVMVVGGMGGMIGGALFGWYSALEGFVFGGLAATGLILALTVLLGAIFGGAYLAYRAWQRYWPSIHPKMVFHLEWGQLKPLRPVYGALGRVKRYLSAEDVPEDSTPKH